jgi:hypothetical protein
VELPAQLCLLDRQCTEILVSLLVPPNFPPESILTAEDVAERVLNLVARLNSREALIACTVCALCASDDGSLERGAHIEEAIIDLHNIIARTRREPLIPSLPAWLATVQSLIAKDRDTEEDEKNASMRGQKDASVALVEKPVLSCTAVTRDHNRVNRSQV